MSWLFSQALAVEFWPESCSDGEPFAPSNGNPTQLAYLPPDRMTAFSRLSRFGMTFRPLTADRGAELLTLYLAAFRAKTLALQERAQASPEIAAECGDTWRGSLARFDPDTFSWKTVQHSLLEDSELSSVTWPRSGMTANGQCWELPTLGRRTSATGSGLWPTPTVCGNYNRKGASAASGDGLATAVQKWPTPTARCHKGGGKFHDTQGWEESLRHARLGGGAPDWYASEPDVGRVADGVAARVDRLKALGNGQLPACAAAAWRLLAS